MSVMVRLKLFRINRVKTFIATTHSEILKGP